VVVVPLIIRLPFIYVLGESISVEPFEDAPIVTLVVAELTLPVPISMVLITPDPDVAAVPILNVVASLVTVLPIVIIPAPLVLIFKPMFASPPEVDSVTAPVVAALVIDNSLTADAVALSSMSSFPFVSKIDVPILGDVNVLFVNVSVPAVVANVPVVGKVTEVFPPVVKPNVCAPVCVKFPPNVKTVAAPAIVLLALFIVNVLAASPVNVIDSLTVSVLPFAIVNVDDVAGAVIVTLFIEVAVAAPKVGVTNVGDVANTKDPEPVSSDIDVAN